MSTFRIVAEVDVDITDSAAAHALAQAYLSGQLAEHTPPDGRAHPNGIVPAELIETFLGNAAFVNIILANVMLKRGAQQVPMAHFTNLRVSRTSN